MANQHPLVHGVKARVSGTAQVAAAEGAPRDFPAYSAALPPTYVLAWFVVAVVTVTALPNVAGALGVGAVAAEAEAAQTAGGGGGLGAALWAFSTGVHQRSGGEAGGEAASRVVLNTPDATLMTITSFAAALTMAVGNLLMCKRPFQRSVASCVCGVFGIALYTHVRIRDGHDVVLHGPSGCPFSLLQHVEWCFTTGLLMVLLRALEAQIAGTIESNRLTLTMLVADEVMIVAGVLAQYLTGLPGWYFLAVAYMCFFYIMIAAFRSFARMILSPCATEAGERATICVVGVLSLISWSGFGVVSVLYSKLHMITPVQAGDAYLALDFLSKVVYTALLGNAAVQAAEENAMREHVMFEQLNDMQRKFFFNVTHELRTPLNAVIGFTTLVSESHELDDMNRGFLNSALTSADALLGLINQMLDYTKFSTQNQEGAVSVELDRETFTPERLFAQIIDISQKASQRATELTYSLNDPSAFLHSYTSDYFRMRQCLVNLVDNAIKYSRPSDGQVHVDLEISQLTSSHALFTFRIIDNGCGIPKELQADIFKPFQQPTNKKEAKRAGTGLGLVITKNIAQAMQGDISFVSEEGVGTTFTLKIPVEYADGGEATAATVPDTMWETNSAALRPNTRTILYIGSENVRKNIILLLGKHGGRRGLNFLEVDGHEQMSKAVASASGNGVQVVLIVAVEQWLREEIPHGVIPVVVAFPHELVSLQKKSPASQRLCIYLPKPVKPSDFESMLLRLQDDEWAVQQTPMPAMNRLAEKRRESEESRKKSAGEDLRLDGMRVLLVEDNLLNQKLATHSLQTNGAEVVIANHGQEAIDLLQKGKGPFGLILMDHMMPVLDGADATKIIRNMERNGECPKNMIVGLSANVGPEYVASVKEAGMDGTMPKPFVPGKLRELAYKVLHGTYQGFE